MRTLYLAVPLLAACHFSGEEANLRFASNLSTPTHPFVPVEDAVAVGSTLEFHAEESATAFVDDERYFDALEAGDGTFSGVVARAGSTTLRWDGAVTDHFPVRAEAAVGGALDDPLRQLDVDFVPVLRWPAPGSDVVMVPGTTLFLEVQLTSADGGQLAHSPGSVTVSTEGSAVEVTSVGAGLLLDATASDAGTEAAAVSWSYLDQVWGRFEVRTASADQVARLELVGSTAPRDTEVALKAIARLSDGSTLWQAPVEWTFDPHLRALDVHRFTEAYAPRPDVLLLGLSPEAGTPPADDDGYWTTKIRARSGSVSAVYEARLRVAAPKLAAVQPAPAATPTEVTQVKPPNTPTLPIPKDGEVRAGDGTKPVAEQQAANNSCGCGACEGIGIIFIFLILLLAKGGGLSWG